MASAVESKGLVEFRRGVQRLPDAVTAKLRGVAEATATRIQTRARDLLLSKSNARKTAAAITVREDVSKHQFLVESSSAAGDPDKNVVYLEFGTVKQAARPYMRPAGDGEQDRYRRDMAAAAITAVQDVLR